MSGKLGHVTMSGLFGSWRQRPGLPVGQCYKVAMSVQSQVGTHSDRVLNVARRKNPNTQCMLAQGSPHKAEIPFMRYAKNLLEKCVVLSYIWIWMGMQMQISPWTL